MAGGFLVRRSVRRDGRNATRSVLTFGFIGLVAGCCSKIRVSVAIRPTGANLSFFAFYLLLPEIGCRITRNMKFFSDRRETPQNSESSLDTTVRSFFLLRAQRISGTELAHQGVRLRVSVTQRRCRLKAALRARSERRLQPAAAGVTGRAWCDRRL